MRPTCSTRFLGITFLTWVVLLCALAGCNDLSQRYLGGLRKESTDNGPPQLSPELAIRNAPKNPQALTGTAITQASYDPQREAPAALPLAPMNDPNVPQNPLRFLYQRAAQRHASMDSYIFRLRRREVVGGDKKPEELLEVKLRQQPFSVYLKWLGTEGKGREVIYVRGKYENKMQVQLEPGSVFSLFGRRQSVAPDDAMARSKSRHPITDTGFGSMIDSFGRLVGSIERGEPGAGSAKYLGRVPRAEFSSPLEVVHQIIPAGSDPLLPRGGQRYWYFDPVNGLPVLYITEDTDREVEYYCHDNIQFPVRLDEDDFNPDRLWHK